MITDEQLHQELIKAIEKAGGVSAWATQVGLFDMRSHIDKVYQGTRKISETVADKLGYKRGWVKKYNDATI